MTSAPDEANMPTEETLQRARHLRRMMFVALAISAFAAIAIYYVAAEPGPNSTLHRHLKESGYKPLF